MGAGDARAPSQSAVRATKQSERAVDRQMAEAVFLLQAPLQSDQDAAAERDTTPQHLAHGSSAKNTARYEH